MNNIKRQPLTAAIVLGLLALSLIGTQIVLAQNTTGEQLTASISPSGDIEGLAVYFTTTINGGTPPYSLQWYINDTPVEDATASHYTFSPNTFGTYYVYVVANDSLNSSATSNITTVAVKPYLQIDLSTHNYLTDTTVGQSVYFAATVSNGVPPYRYQWYYRLYQFFGSTPSEISPIGDEVEASTSQNFTFTANSAGHYLITVRVWDSQNTEGYFMSLLPGIWVNVAALTGSPSQSPSATSSLTPSPTAISPDVPEFSTWIILPLFALAILLSTVFIRKRIPKK